VVQPFKAVSWRARKHARKMMRAQREGPGNYCYTVLSASLDQTDETNVISVRPTRLGVTFEGSDGDGSGRCTHEGIETASLVLSKRRAWKVAVLRG
jgi:hypothetical protein